MSDYQKITDGIVALQNASYIFHSIGAPDTECIHGLIQAMLYSIMSTTEDSRPFYQTDLAELSLHVANWVENKMQKAGEIQNPNLN